MQKLITSIIFLFLFIEEIVYSQNNIIDDQLFTDFQNFIIEHNKTYRSLNEINSKFYKFSENHFQLNKDKFNNSYNVSLNKFSDYSKEEFANKFLKLKISEDEELSFLDNESNKRNLDETVNDFLAILPSKIIIKARDINNGTNISNILSSDTLKEIYNITEDNITIPSYWDWREKNVVGSVKEQGDCGGCWAFTAASVVESQYAIANNKVFNLSVEQLLDCDFSNRGCEGGATSYAFSYIKSISGLQSEETYKYTGNPGKCMFNESLGIATIKSFRKELSHDEEKMKKIVFTNGPIAGAMDATGLQFFSGGIYKCPQKEWKYKNLNHAVTIVGYGTNDSGEDYWIIKNSWGSSWGEKGYFKLERNTNACGINLYVVVTSNNE